ncbi:MAG TPA: DNA mismatch repair protein MutS [Blastocatellia bacterium]|nr:DNA mismatch repair protein MutS [Blastocatellia bacterium]
MTTPLRQQYLDIRRRYPGLILLFQIGDFYECFDDDARVVARELGVALTRKYFGKGQYHPLAGVPVRSLETHLAKLIQRGHKVAICDQVTLPGKGLVEREVTRIITPGTVIEPGLLEGRANNFLASLVRGERQSGLAFVDVSTGEFSATQLDNAQALIELERQAPAELLLARSTEWPALEVRSITKLDDKLLELATARKALLEHFHVKTLAAFGLEHEPQAIQAAGAIIAYLRDSQPDALANLTRLQSYRTDNFMRLDPNALRNLEVFQSWDFTGGAPTGSLVNTIDLTLTPMGGRLLRRWLRYPLLNVTEIRARQDAVEWFVKKASAREKLREALTSVLDIERLLGRIRRRIAVPSEVVTLAHSLRALPEIRATLEKAKAPAHFIAPLEQCNDLVEYVSRAITDRPPSDFERGNIIRTGFARELDELRDVLSGGRDFLSQFEARQRSRTGIKSLKVSYNKVFGYYLEVTKANLHLVPKDFIRKQTLVNAERYFTLELKEHEALIANAKERILELEVSLYRQVCDELSRHHDRISKVAVGIAQLDVFAALAECAARFAYVRPELNEDDELNIRQGRHPMIEQRLEGRSFVANDTHLANHDTQIMLLTAPNMAGKSVYLRQVALLVLLAQIGSFVPAAAATIGITDRIFTRVGLTDYTLQGHSSFMVEMIETAAILHNATPRSLILLDEVGRGTATADGLSIARSIVEYVHNHPKIAAKTMFATHYHELTDCADYLPRVKNFHLAVKETGRHVEYLHRVEPGRAEKSFGIHVAEIAGLPKPVIRRARTLLNEYDHSNHREKGARSTATHTSLPLAELLQKLSALDINALSPIEALSQLFELQAQAKRCG